MSAFVGVLRLEGAGTDEAWLRAAAGRLTDPGAPDPAVRLEGPIGLGQALFGAFSVVSAAPTTLDGSTWIVADARIDARDELCVALAGARETVDRDAPASELILRAYGAWGDRCVERLIGDYSFAIWDDSERRLFAARDLLGVKLFYYANRGGAFAFSNSLETVRSHPGVSERLNDVAIMDFLVAGLNQDLATTTFLDIQRIPPGHALSMRAGDGSPRVWRHSELPSPSLARHRTDRDVVEHFRSVFREAVSDRLTEPAAGVFMSGGIDSPGLAAMAKRVLEDRGAAYDLRAVTVVWDEAIPDEERRYAGLVAERLGMPIEYVVADAFEPFEGWGTEPLGRPEPYDEPELQSWVAECRAMTRHARVGLYGEDPDTLLMPVPLRGELRRDRPLALAGRVARYVKANGRLPYMGTGLAARFRSPPSAPQSPADATEYPTWLDSKFERSVGGRERYDDWWAEPKLNGSAHAEPHRMLSSPLWQSFLESLDSGVTGFPLEIRLPYMDVRVVEFLLSLPTVPWRQKKHLLRASLEGWLPTEVLERPKAPLNGAFEARLLHWKTHAPPLDGVERDLLDAYVDVFALERRLSSGEQTAWTDLRPIALGHWLTQVAG